MTTYLTIITTVLVLTQIIRITQNHINLRIEKKRFDENCKWVEDAHITERDFEVQRDVYYMLRMWLENELEIDYGACEEEVKDEHT